MATKKVKTSKKSKKDLNKELSDKFDIFNKLRSEWFDTTVKIAELTAKLKPLEELRDNLAVKLHEAAENLAKSNLSEKSFYVDAIISDLCLSKKDLNKIKLFQCQICKTKLHSPWFTKDISRRIYSSIYGQHHRNWSNLINFVNKNKLPNHGNLFKILNYFINGNDVERYSTEGTATPDHVIRVKPFPLIIKPKHNSSIGDFKKTAIKAFNNYKKKYLKYFEQNQKKVKEKKTMLDTSPRVILVQNIGVFCIGDNLKAAKVAADLTETNARVISSVEETSKYKFISKKDIFDVEYWSLEQAKIKKETKELAGNVVVITGAFGKIGTATYKLFKKYGAEVVLIDNNRKKVTEMSKKINDLCIYCDVTNKESVKKAFNLISSKLGGIDILISNAGTALGGPIAEVDDKILRKSFEDNFFSHQNCAAEATKIMKTQNIEGCLLFNISKQSVNPGKNFGPYGLPKSALLNLCKQYALDYGSYGIRSNGVNADRIRSGLLNDEMIKSRAKARDVSTEDYMKGNLLLNEVKAEDVAKAFFHLSVSKKTTGAILTVDGGNIAASLR